MIKHIVLWKINKDGTPEDRQKTLEEFHAKMEYLKTIIPEIKEARVALSYNGGDAFHLCIDSVFESDEALQAYINHPEHLKVRAWLNTVAYDKTAFDYEM
ncbi:MAG: Dabb family protein [Coprococcus sp.]|nr:Dabb family protein [Coprococcus sp.]